MNELSCIQNFVENFQFMEGVALPSNFPPPLPQKPNILLKKVCHIFENPQEVTETIKNTFNHQFYRQIRGWNDPYENGIRLFYLAREGVCKVSFENGKVQEKLILEEDYVYQIPEVKKIITIAMERLSLELGWQNTTRLMRFNAIEYIFKTNSQEPLRWHCDETGSSQAKHTFIILLDNPLDNEKGWQGGDLLYAKGRFFDIFNLKLEEKEKVYQLDQQSNRQLFVEPNTDVWRIKPSYNDAILFGNEGMVHKVTEMQPIKEVSKRMILTIFDYGEC